MLIAKTKSFGTFSDISECMFSDLRFSTGGGKKKLLPNERPVKLLNALNPRNTHGIDYGGFSGVDSPVEFFMLSDIIYFAKSLAVLYIQDVCI